MKILSVNISEQKGTTKHPVESIRLTPTGIDGDAHAGNWHRQVSLLGIESFQEGFLHEANPSIGNHPQCDAAKTTDNCRSSEGLQQCDARIAAGAFRASGGPQYGVYAENITTSGTPSGTVKILKECNPGDRFVCGKVILEVTQIGKKCHGDGCAVMKETGLCVMPTDGIFAKVIHGGELRAGDELTYMPRIWKTAVITLSTRASQGTYPDLSGPTIIKMLEKFCQENHWPQENKYLLIPDDKVCLQAEIQELARDGYDLIFTTGGTGFGQTDITTETIRPMLEKEIPGIMEFIRYKYGSQNPNALLSTSIAGIIGSASIFCLPGSVRAVTEYFTEISRILRHLDAMRRGQEH